MGKIISAIPNVCEGKDEKFINGLTARLKNVEELAILDVSMDKTRNRTVVAFTGPREAVFEGGMLLYEESLKHIDMRRHKGEYPRLGSVDVFPFVPLQNMTIEEVDKIAVEFARLVADKFHLPVYLFGESARFPLRKDIENIRAAQYEGLEEQLKDPRWKPDFGPDEFKPDFGATIIGARYPLVSFKLLLDTDDMDVTKSICRSIQYSTGGLRFVTANAGVAGGETNYSQVAVSISNHKVTPIYKVIELARLEARRFAVKIKEVEMIGLIPEIVFLESAMYYMNINNFSYDRLLEKTIQRLLDEKTLFFT
ncbi:MAG: glutamate formimidoyltransferase [bacterium]|nr:glutamate formimidoyltransferase [bacterium]